MLKYNFEALYSDGEVYKQNAEDVSIKDEKRSCFYDIDHERLVGFILKGEGHEYGVDLRDGHFEIDGIPFFMHDDIREDVGGGRVKIIKLKDFRLIFYRQHTHVYKPGEKKPEELSHDIAYFMGWQCTVDSKNYQQVMKFT